LPIRIGAEFLLELDRLADELRGSGDAGAGWGDHLEAELSELPLGSPR